MIKLLAKCALGIAILGFAAARGLAAGDVTDSVSTSHHCRISNIEGMKVQNGAGVEIGKIKDMVIDFKTGKIAYAALDFGGFLGIGDKLFAVPWSAFVVTENGGGRHLILNVSKERLKDAPGFDKSHWPDVANPNWAAEVDRYYTPQRTTGSPR